MGMHGLAFRAPSFASGAARVLDLGATFDEYNSCASGNEADIRALYSDWVAVGGDLNAVIEAGDVRAAIEAMNSRAIETLTTKG
jgi:hypothetical protein